MRSKFIIGLVIVVMCAVIPNCYAAITVKDIRFDTVRPESDLVKLLRSKFDQHNLDIAGIANLGTGKVFYVDSNAGGSSTSVGTTPASAAPTLDDGINLCTGSRGDIIYVMQGHQEVLAAAGNIFDIDVAGITVIGISNGGMSGPVATGAATLNIMPIFILDHADATATISAPNCKIAGLRFESDVADNAIGLTMSAAADGSIVSNCIFRDGAAAEEMVIAINVVADCDNIQLIGNTFSTVAAGGCANAIVLAGGSDNSVIAGNTVYGTYSAGALLASAALSVF